MQEITLYVFLNIYLHTVQYIHNFNVQTLYGTYLINFYIDFHSQIIKNTFLSTNKPTLT